MMAKQRAESERKPAKPDSRQGRASIQELRTPDKLAERQPVASRGQPGRGHPHAQSELGHQLVADLGAGACRNQRPRPLSAPPGPSAVWPSTGRGGAHGGRGGLRGQQGSRGSNKMPPNGTLDR